MVRPVESIRKDLKALEGVTATLAEEFSQNYATYLTVLGQALHRQVIMATYHLCTQVYPEEFLALTVSDRSRLQQNIQTLGRNSRQWLLDLLEPNQTPVDLDQRLDPDELNRLGSALAALTSGIDSAENHDSESHDSENRDSENQDFGDQDLAKTPEESYGDVDIPNAAESDRAEPDGAESAVEASQIAADASDDGESLKDSEVTSRLDPKTLVQSVIMAAMASDPEASLSDRPFTGDPLTPTLVAKHHLILEQRIREVLQRVSRKANQLLRQAKLIPDLPEAVLEAAADADIATAKGRSAPNVLNVLVAITGDIPEEFGDPEPDGDDDTIADSDDGDGDDDEALEGTMTHLAAIQLRLSDLEFGDVQSALWRSKLRTAVGRLRKLGKQYQQAERELAIAQAEQAWRAVWYDDSSR
ncbi:hypothetical protein [Nodosilinea sp. E11]|uniref:hypothetical protein n=1 Tax=Nodosilinea sp. E11 TaxID=3037479 RepID=UPI0029343A5B|nr:hypothetical protein [Nodosilinea sp. E11]WOD39312.1 hypothetical protein RRF56_24190 [Nodosilinea sp. E11]